MKYLANGDTAVSFVAAFGQTYFILLTGTYIYGDFGIFSLSVMVSARFFVLQCAPLFCNPAPHVDIDNADHFVVGYELVVSVKVFENSLRFLAECTFQLCLKSFLCWTA